MEQADVESLLDERLRSSLTSHRAEMLRDIEGIVEKISGNSNVAQISKISNLVSGEKFKRKSNEEQFKFNAQVKTALDEAEHYSRSDKQDECRRKIAEDDIMWLNRQCIWEIISVFSLYMCHCDGEVDQVNVAFGKTASQSGTLHYPDNISTAYWNAGTAVDGKKSCTSADSTHYSGTVYQHRPWWQVDLGSVYNISSIYVYGKDNPSRQDQFDGFRVIVGTTNSTAVNQVQHNYTRNTNLMYDLVPGPMYGRYVTVYLPQAVGHSSKPLVLCEVEVFVDNLIPRINVKTSMSPAWKDFNASLAVDGKQPTYSNFDACKCCSVAGSGATRYWEVDLRAKYLIGAVYISGRSDNEDQTRNFSVVASNTTYIGGNGGDVIFSIQNPTKGHVFMNNTYPPRLFEFLQIIRNTLLTICEVRLVQTECDVGSFGDRCLRHCHCGDGKSCGASTGQCQTLGCTSGWNGTSCETTSQPIKCIAGCPGNTFGKDCKYQSHCLSGDSGDLENGICVPSKCEDGWMKDNCSIACSNGTFGSGCPYTSHCINGSGNDRADGTCFKGACDPGFQLKNCSIACDHGTFGHNCSEKCHCWNKIDCGKPRGICPTNILHVCDAGWMGTSCDKACTNGTFGPDCKHTSHCINGSKNNPANGTCYRGMCDPGWQMDNCSVECDHGKFGNCSESCYCWNKIDCEKTLGFCQNNTHRCEAGWMGMSCNKACTDGRFGPDCKHTSHCINGSKNNPVNGTCYRGICDPGWQMDNCSIECDHGKFGKNCSQICKCWKDVDCEKPRGFCPNKAHRCAAGRMGMSCDKDCTDGGFGPDCKHTSHCINGSKNNPVNGTCYRGMCDPGWQMDNCSVECDHGYFGMNCSCQCHCLYGIDCGKTNGYCSDTLPRCEPGWKGKSCDYECTNGTFGNDCIHSSHCINGSSNDPASGVCSEGTCDPGWQLENCTLACNHGYFGMNCSSYCHCHNQGDCNKVHGFCEAASPHCDDGWRGESCDLACYHRNFGMNCSSYCHCYNNTDCKKDTGACIYITEKAAPKCEDQWTGDSCDSQVSAADHQDGSSGAMVGGIVGAVAAVAVAAIVAVVLLLRRRALSRKQNETGVGMQFSGISNKPEVSTPHAEGNANEAFSDENNEYYAFSPLKSEIKPHQIWHYVRKMQRDGCKSFNEEFQKLPYGLIKSYDVSQRQENKGKSRYREMYAYDHSRVVLDITGPEQTDFVNANYVHFRIFHQTVNTWRRVVGQLYPRLYDDRRENGFGNPRKFIASQGPTENMVKDFWRMVWQQRVNKIVMLTNPMEGGANKCIVYWPEEGEEVVYGDITIVLVQTDSLLDYNRRKLRIQMKDEQARTVEQFHFKSWPDKDVPDSTWCLVKFWTAVNQGPANQDSPIVVHCSAGVGRTGTYIALDYLYHQAMEEGAVRPLQAAMSLRQQRVNMVQTKEQYAYLHEALADVLGLGTHSIYSSQFEDVYRFLIQSDPRIGKTRLVRQFELLEESLRDNENDMVITDDDQTYANVSVANEETYRPKARKRGSKYAQELGAMYLPNYLGANAFLVVKSPTDSSLPGFWSLVQDENVKTIVSLCEPSAKNYKTCCDLGAESASVNGMFVVKRVQTSTQRSHTTKLLVFHEQGKTGDEDVATVQVFDYTAWKAGYNTPGEALSLIDLLEAIGAWQPHMSESQPILLHCGTGTRRCGILCLVLSELQRLKREDGQINILDSLMKMKQRNPKIIENEDQYRFCHEAILTHLHQQQNQNMYANM